MNYTRFNTINKSHKKRVDSVTRGFPPYCDFQFSNLLSWSSHKNPTKLAVINGNLAVKMKEYATDKVIIMFMGKRNVVQSIKELVDKYEILERVPQEVITELSKSAAKDFFDISEDSNNHDYVLSLENVASLSGNKFKSKRKKVRAFERNYPTHKVEIMKPDPKKLMPVLRRFFHEIAKEKGIEPIDLADELEAVEKLLKHRKLFNLPILGVKHHGKLVGFTINEIFNGAKSDTALGCFGKGLRKYKGIYAYLEVITAKYLLQKDMKYINIEEDMGFKGLRESKRLWRPAVILKKYVIRKKLLND